MSDEDNLEVMNKLGIHYQAMFNINSPTCVSVWDHKVCKLKKHGIRLDLQSLELYTYFVFHVCTMCFVWLHHAFHVTVRHGHCNCVPCILCGSVSYDVKSHSLCNMSGGQRWRKIRSSKRWHMFLVLSQSICEWQLSVIDWSESSFIRDG